MPVRQIVRIDEERCNGCGECVTPLIPIRYQGHSIWVCTRCLPSLIHG